MKQDAFKSENRPTKQNIKQYPNKHQKNKVYKRSKKSNKQPTQLKNPQIQSNVSKTVSNVKNKKTTQKDVTKKTFKDKFEGKEQ
jgi:hypothetical protein